MRYTTIIDIREMPLYRSDSVRLLYLHLCLSAGYHEEDRDICQVSIRHLGYQTGLSVSAVRHALTQLLKASLIRKTKNGYQVAKFVMSDAIPKRAKTKREQRDQEETRQRELQQLERERQAAASKVDSIHPALYRGLKALGISNELMGTYNATFKAKYNSNQVQEYLEIVKSQLNQ